MHSHLVSVYSGLANLLVLYVRLPLPEIHNLGPHFLFLIKFMLQGFGWVGGH